MSLTRLLLALLACALGCATRTAEPHARDPAASAWHYRVRIDATLARSEIELCFDGPVPRELRAGKDEAANRLRYARWLRPGPVRKLPVVRGRIQLPSDLQAGCLAYGVSLRDGGSLDAAVRRVGSDLLASPNAWLWRPQRRAETVRATLKVTAAAGVHALLPWPERDGLYQLDARAFRFDSYAAFGALTPLRRASGSVDGVDVQLALLDGALAIDASAALRWLLQAIALHGESHGPFPAERLTALIVPNAGAGVPVPFGMVARGGPPSLLLIVNEGASEAQLARDWVLPHELSHLLLPFVPRADAWLSEGLASYYQELMRARAGVSSERETFQRLAEALRSAERERGMSSVVADSASLAESRNYSRVYWGGAAFWLGLDVELRRLSHNAVTLDAALAALRAEGQLDRIWSARELLTRLDALAPAPLFSQAAKLAESRPFPPFEQTLRALGVHTGAGGVELDDNAELSAVRRALTAAAR